MDPVSNKSENNNITDMISERMPVAYSFNVETPTQLVDIMTEQEVYLPMDISLHQMGNIRFIIVTRHLRQIPFDIIKIDNFWFIEKIFYHELSNYLKQGDRLLIINKTMISDQLQETEIFKLILHSSAPFIIWVTWDVDTFIKHQIKSRQCKNEDAYIDAKAYLLKTNDYRDISLYDQLAIIIENILQNPQNDIHELFEKLEYPILQSNLRTAKDDTDLIITKIHAQLLQGKEKYLLKSKDYVIKAVPYLMDIANHCSNAGYGIHTTEMILIWSAMKRLNNQINCTEMKFWGKIFGICCDYYIVQIQHEKEITFDEIDISEREQKLKVKKISKHTNHQLSDQKLSTEIPSEPHGIGTNQYTYFVTNSPGLPWIKLPDVKPATINYVRKIRCLFTGCLLSQVTGFPPIFGLEKDYLRAQIARITATTHISPAGYYMLTDVEEEEETTLNEERKEPNIIINSEFNNDLTNPITVEQLANSNLEEWVHSLPEILPQGRTRFWRPPSTQTTNSITEEDDNEEILNENNLQIPAPLLQPISDDKLLYTDQTPWSVGLTMSVMQEYSMCYVRSNIWPGAFTLGNAENYFNLYIGWGQKYEQFNPSHPSVPETEYSQELIEKNDPSVEFEEAQRIAALELTSEEYTSDEEENEEQLTDEEEEEEEQEND
ncbi:unnamed protein product [Adineta steineri]|uniref:Uncharacterized protein n=1 Tax=Adineta steineri TaxID=433720 RepID=A0A814NF22_9BILA|nr:unnamed protein product [Adineta steineri]CAF1091275.1 unnamed protein product [Adineta steineri]